MQASNTPLQNLDGTRPATASPEAPVGLRQRKKLQTFRALQSAARRLVGERGLDNVTIDEIAAAADVSPRTFFNYFDSKEAAIVGRGPSNVERLAAALAVRPADETPLQALRSVCIATLASQARDLQELTALVCANPSLIGWQVNAFKPFERVIVEWAAARTGTDPDTDAYPALLAEAAFQMMRLTVARWRPESGDEGFIQLADEILTLIAGGLAAPSHRHPAAPIGTARMTARPATRKIHTSLLEQQPHPNGPAAPGAESAREGSRLTRTSRGVSD